MNSCLTNLGLGLFLLLMTAAAFTTTALATTAPNNNDNDSISSNMSNPVEAMNRLGECLVIEDPNEKNECYDQLLEDKYGSVDD